MKKLLTNEKVLDMKNKYKSGSKIKELHKEFGIKYTTCWHIIKGNGHSL
jgi:Mor family transcriptional regulator